MTGNVRLITPNDSDAATLTATPAAVTTLPVSNLQDATRTKLWRSTSAAAQAIKGGWDDSYQVAAFSLVRHNLSPSAKLQFRLWEDAAQSGTLLYDSGEVSIGTVIGWGDLVWGIDPWGGSNIFSGWAYAFTTLWFDEVTARSFQLDLTDTANPDGYLQASRLVVGPYFEPLINADYGLSMSWEESSTQQRTDGGTLRTDAFDPYRRWSFGLSHLDPDERATLTEIVRKVGLRQDFFLSCFPEAGGELERDYAGMAKIVQIPKFGHNRFENFESELIFEES